LFLAKALRNTERWCKKLRVQKMYKRTSLFVALKMKMIHYRRKVRFGFTFDKRFETEVVHNRFNFLITCIHDSSTERASNLIFRLLLAKQSERVLQKKVEYFGKCVTMIQRCRMFESLSSIYRKAYLKRYFYKEMDFVATHFLNKNNKGGRQIYKKIMELDPILVRRMMALYLILKQKLFYKRCFQDSI
jgi:hypothetical protein